MSETRDRVLIGQLTDPHIDGADRGSAAAAALARAVGAMAALRPRPDAVLMTGDLANTAADAEYELIRELLAPLRCPVHVLAGNHDEPDAVRRQFGLPGSPGEPLQYAVRVGPVRVLLCDTTLPGRDDGALDAERRAWLEGELAADPRAPTLVAMHHSPLTTGVRGMDELGLPAADLRALDTLLAGHPQVLRVVAGHVHRAVVATLGGRVVFACPSTHEQLLLDLDPVAEMRPAPDPPAIALHLLQDGELSSHLQPIGAAPA